MLLTKPFSYLLSLVLLVVTINCFAWNALGHMVISDIAYKHLNPKAKQKVDKLIQLFGTEYPNVKTIMEFSTWPDNIRSQRIETYTRWHYIDIPFTQDKTALSDTVTADNARWAVKTIRHVVENPHANPYERARFLAFMIHIVEDLHQPLHTTTRISARLAKGDRGGNLFKVSYKGSKMNLHHLWDAGVGLLEGEVSVRHAQSLSAMLINQHPLSAYTAKSHEITPETWEKEGMSAALKMVYNVRENEEVSASYVHEGQKAVEEILVVAGYRLAYLLNQLLDDK